MKIFISADIEGVTGCTNWDETNKSHKDHPYFARQMSLEVDAACKGANKAGAKEIMVRDAHDSARNIDHNLLPRNTKLVRGWGGTSLSMMQEIDHTYDAVIFIGYHAGGGHNTNPLAHTMNSSSIDYISINGRVASEFIINSYSAAYFNVPVVFISGDNGLENDLKFLDENIGFFPVKEGVGRSTISIHPELAIEEIENKVEEALNKDLSIYKIELPEEFVVEIRYTQHNFAGSYKDYPNAEQVDEKTVRFKTNDYMEVLRFFKFGY